MFFPIQFFSQIRRVALKHLGVDLALLLISFLTATLLRLGPDEIRSYIPILLVHVPGILFIRIICMIAFGCYSVMWRYISTSDASRLTAAIATSTVLIICLTFFVADHSGRLPRSVYLIDSALALLFLMGARVYRRLLYEGSATRQTLAGKKTLIYGAGRNGRLLAQRFKSDFALDTNLIGFIDDNPKKADLIIQGIPVLGNSEDLSQVIEQFRVSQVIIAIPNLPGELLRRIVMATRPFNIKPRITNRLTALNERSNDDNRVDIYRDVELTDLLNREARKFDLQSVRELVKGKCVLVTGAGGSIGSELARQILGHEPERVLLLDHSEFNLYEIDKELRLSSYDTERVVPLLVDLKDEASLRNSLRLYMPSVVFHAAAYKHVHLVESNPHSSILNNVQGTQSLLSVCEQIGVDTFVQISTDKAVNPAGVMGATKRVCELLVTAMAIKTGKRYCSVRFGNVLGSSGSLIPLLTTQIRNRGPVTITHPDMTRFFMLIPEAVSLVLKAATIANPGEINVLKMGDPVKILDVAQNLIALMGASEADIPIVFTGLRPGEKMFEELYLRGDELLTEHPDILTLPNGDSNLRSQGTETQSLLTQVGEMIRAAQTNSPDALATLNAIVKSTYVSSPNETKDGGNISFLQIRSPGNQ
jgi:FlaA1/EpsC-like NDP-sugar epimerase